MLKTFTNQRLLATMKVAAAMVSTSSKLSLVLLFSVTASTIFFVAPKLTLAQSTEPKVKVGDQAEVRVDFFINSNDRHWRKATVVKILSGGSPEGGSQKDGVFAAIADAVISQGARATIEPALLADLKIPNSKSGSVSFNSISRAVKTPTAKDRFHTVSVIVTDKRYVQFTRRIPELQGGTEMVAVVDDVGEMVGRQIFRQTGKREMPLTTANQLVEYDSIDWANLLINRELLANARFYRKESTIYLVMADDGKFYLVGPDNLRTHARQ